MSTRCTLRTVAGALVLAILATHVCTSACDTEVSGTFAPSRGDVLAQDARVPLGSARAAQTRTTIKPLPVFQ